MYDRGSKNNDRVLECSFNAEFSINVKNGLRPQPFSLPCIPIKTDVCMSLR